jgi:EpsI family protein
MDRTKYLIIVAAVLLSGLAGLVLELYTPRAETLADWSDFPMQHEGWVGAEEVVSAWVIDLLKPDRILNVNYTDSSHRWVNLFLGSFTDPRGGPHSPMNCLPASGWIIVDIEPRPISVGERTIAARRLRLQYQREAYVVDYWYITPFGATSSDYTLKFLQMLTALKLQPQHLTFVRFLARDTESGRTALDRFEQSFIDEIYRRLPAGQH